jgi:hypothetical protein
MTKAVQPTAIDMLDVPAFVLPFCGCVENVMLTFIAGINIQDVVCFYCRCGNISFKLEAPI